MKENEELSLTLSGENIYEAFGYIMGRDKKKNINLRISNELLDKVNSTSLKLNINRNSLIIIMICKALKDSQLI